MKLISCLKNLFKNKNIKIYLNDIKRRITTNSIYKNYALVYNFFYDWKRFSLYSSAIKSSEDEWTLDTKILMMSHALEKGFSLRKPKAIFGLDLSEDLKELISKREKLFGSSWISKMANDILKELYLHNSQSNIIKDNKSRIATKIVSKNTFLNYEEFSKFVKLRHSSRQFSSKDVNIDLVLDAIHLAQRSPSVCNRQSIKCFVIKNKALINRLLELQNGNKGFRKEINTLITIIADTRGFYFSTERNQPWIDGGLFSMLLTLGLHSHGIGSCCLNWCVHPKVDLKIRKLLPLNNSEVIIMLMAVGHLQDSYVVASSYRRPIEDVVTII